LLPDVADQTAGDAVPLYLMARGFWPDLKTTKEILGPEDSKYDYLDTPTEQFPPQYAQRLFDGYAQTLAYADQAARRRDAHWDLTWPDGDRSFQLSYLNDLRHMANLLGFRGRYQVVHGDWAGADYTLQTAFAMGRHIGQTPLLVHALVECGFAEVELSRPVWQWIGQSGSPNLYWSLTDLPTPLVELRPVAQWEKLEARDVKSPVEEAIRGKLPADQWPTVIRQMAYAQRDHLISAKPDPKVVELDARKSVESSNARAREYLIAHGRTAQQLDAMSHDETVGRYWCEEYQRASDDLWKFWTFEYPQASQYILQSWHALGPDRSPALENPLIQDRLVPNDGYGPVMDFPMMLRARYNLARTDRHIAMLRIIEALRDCAAHHDGRPPERLEQINNLPIPLDPITGKDFSYHVEGQTAILEALAPPMMSKASGWRFELTFVK